MKKRVLALLTVLALCLALAPAVTVYGDPPAAGLYSDYTPQAGVSGFIRPFSKMTLNGGEVTGIYVGYTRGNALDCYFFAPDADFSTLQFSGNDYSYATLKGVSPTVFHISISDQCTGAGTVSVSFSEGDHSAVFPLVFDDGSGDQAQRNGNQGNSNGLFRSMSQTGQLSDPVAMATVTENGHDIYKYIIGYTPGDAFAGATYYYYDSTHPFAEDFSLSTGYRYVTVIRQNEDVLRIVIDSQCTGDAQFGLEYTVGESRRGFPFLFDDTTTEASAERTQNGSGPNTGPSSAEAQLAGYRQFQPDSIPDAPSGADIAPIPFTYEGKTYYIGPAEDDALRNPLMNKGRSTQEGRSEVVKQCVGFWTLDGDGKTYTTVPSQLFDGLFEDLELSLQRGKYCNRADPSVYYLCDDTDPANPVIDKTHMALLCTNDTPGTWVTVLTGRAKAGIEGDGFAADGSFAAYGQYGVSRTTVISAEHPEEALKDGLAAVNRFFEDCVSTYKPDDPEALGRDPEEVLVFRYKLPYLAGGYAGTIRVPDVRNSRCTFQVIGEGDGSQRVTIRGGIVAGGAQYGRDENGTMIYGGGVTRLYTLDFVGTGDLDDPANVCGAGTGEINAYNCSFSGYFRAMECEGEQNWKLGFENCTFRRNGVAVYMNATGRVDGNCRMSGNTFESNTVAIWLAHFSPMCGMHVYNIQGCRFVENTCDVRNTSGRVFFMPRNLFIHGGVATNIVPCGLPGFDISPVSAYPYLTMDMRDVVYDVSYYGDNAIYISSDLEYQVPIFILNGIARYAVVSQAGDEDQFNGFWLFGNQA